MRMVIQVSSETRIRKTISRGLLFNQQSTILIVKTRCTVSARTCNGFFHALIGNAALPSCLCSGCHGVPQWSALKMLSGNIDQQRLEIRPGTGRQPGNPACRNLLIDSGGKKTLPRRFENGGLPRVFVQFENCRSESFFVIHKRSS